MVPAPSTASGRRGVVMRADSAGWDVQRPVKRGGRFSRFAARPSAASSLSNSRCCSSRSSASPSVKPDLESRLHGALDVTDGAAGPVGRRERLGVVDERFRGTTGRPARPPPHTWCTRPGVMRLLPSSAARPVTISSIALALPTSRASRCVPPVPGRTPSATSGRPILPAPGAGHAQIGGHRHLEPAADAVRRSARRSPASASARAGSASRWHAGRSST